MWFQICNGLVTAELTGCVHKGVNVVGTGCKYLLFDWGNHLLKWAHNHSITGSLAVQCSVYPNRSECQGGSVGAGLHMKQHVMSGVVYGVGRTDCGTELRQGGDQ
jgi:hypothetical protein